MPAKKKTTLSSFLKEVKKIVREVDGSVQTLTGSSLNQYLAGALKDVADDAHNKANRPVDNYSLLGVNPNVKPEDLKKVYLALVKIYHESGLSPSPTRMRDINNAYESICKERGWPK